MAVAAVGLSIPMLVLACAGALGTTFFLAGFSGWARLAERYAGELARPRGRVRLGKVEVSRRDSIQPVIYLADVAVGDDGIGLSLPALLTFGARPLFLPWTAMAECAYEPGDFASFLFTIPDRGVEVRLTGRAARLVADAWSRRRLAPGGDALGEPRRP